MVQFALCQRHLCSAVSPRSHHSSSGIHTSAIRSLEWAMREALCSPSLFNQSENASQSLVWTYFLFILFWHYFEKASPSPLQLISNLRRKQLMQTQVFKRDAGGGGPSSGALWEHCLANSCDWSFCKAVHPLFATVITEALEFRECQTSSWGDEDMAEGRYFTETLPLWDHSSRVYTSILWIRAWGGGLSQDRGRCMETAFPHLSRTVLTSQLVTGVPF